MDRLGRDLSPHDSSTINARPHSALLVPAGADHVDDRLHDPEERLGLGDLEVDDLVRHVEHGAGLGVRLVGELDVVHQEHALPRHEHVVEEHHRVHLVEP